jgi:hypothetical protein
MSRPCFYAKFSKNYLLNLLVLGLFLKLIHTTSPLRSLSFPLRQGSAGQVAVQARGLDPVRQL